MRTQPHGILLALSLGTACEPTSSPPDAARPDAASTRLPYKQRYDFDGDGHADSFVGDPAYRASRGALWLIRGSPSGTLPPILLLEGAPLEELGAVPLWIPDRDGDGRLEAGSLSADGTLRWVTSGGAREAAAFTLDPREDVLRLAAVLSDDDDVVLVRRDACEAPHLPCGLAEVVPNDGRAHPRGSPYADVEGTGRRRILSVDIVGGDAQLSAGAWSTTVPGATEVVAIHLAGDVDGDAREDFVVVSPTRAWLVRPRADGALLSEHRVDLVPLRRDLDCDGLDDLAEGALVLLGSADGPRAASMPRPSRLFVGEQPDLDEDGCRDASLSVLLPESPGRVTTGRVRNGQLAGNDLAMLFPERLPRGANWRDEDAVAEADAAAVADLEGDGVEETLPRPSRGSGTTYSFAGDVDGDGAEDVMIAGWGWRVVSGPTVEAVYRSGLHELDALATLTADGWVQPAGDLDGDGLDDLLGQSSCAGTCARSLVWLGRDLSRGLGDPSTTLEGFLQPIGDVNDDGLDDAVLRDSSLRIHLGDPLAGLEATAAISVADMGGVMRGGVLVDAARTTATTLAIGRITTSGVQPFGEPLGVLSTRGATWLDLRDELPLLLLPDGDTEGSLLVRLARDGSRRQLVLPVTLSPSRGGGPASIW